MKSIFLSNIKIKKRDVKSYDDDWLLYVAKWQKEKVEVDRELYGFAESEDIEIKHIYEKEMRKRGLKYDK